MKPVPIEQSIENNILIDSNGCWLWLRYKSKKGYGTVRYNREMRPVHIASYETYIGPVPKGLELDHLCRVKSCCNPGHLEPVTHAENVRRGDSGKYLAIKTHCLWGHEYSDENTYYLKSRTNRVCRACRRQQANSRNLKLKNKKLNAVV